MMLNIDQHLQASLLKCTQSKPLLFRLKIKQKALKKHIVRTYHSHSQNKPLPNIIDQLVQPEPKICSLTRIKRMLKSNSFQSNNMVNSARASLKSQEDLTTQPITALPMATAKEEILSLPQEKITDCYEYDYHK